MRKQIVIFISILFLFGNIYGQQVQYQECTGCNITPNNDGSPENPNQNFLYGVSTPYRPQDVASDFGPRWITNQTNQTPHYDWHIGVDYSRFGIGADDDRGDAIIAIEGGTVVNVAASGGYKYIIIDGTNDFGYGHIFHSNGLPQRSGAFVLTTLDGSTNQYAIINTQTGQAIGRTQGTVTIIDNSTNPPTSTQYTVQTMVITGQAIAPIGGSSGTNYSTNINGGGFGPHIHLYSYRNPNAATPNDFVNTVDPLSVVEYTTPDYFFELSTEGEQANIIMFDYPTEGEQTIKVDLWMNNATDGSGNAINQGDRSNRYSNGTIDIDQVELRLKNADNPSAAYQRIQGPNYEARLTLGGRTNTTIYPTNDLYEDEMEGNWTRTGVMPFAYSDHDGQAKDEYYFGDIALRIHEENMEITTCPMDVRYPDGNYLIQARATDIRGRFFNSDEIETTIDNFQPFIQSVQAQVAGTTVYDKEWACSDCNSGGGITFMGEDLETSVTYQDLVGGMQIIVRASEPLQSLSLSIPELEISNLSASVSDNRTAWTFEVETGMVPAATAISFIFAGMDFSNNPLLSLQTFTNDACRTIPLRTGTETWSINDIPTGIDESHSIGIGCGISNGRSRTGTTLNISSDDCLALNPTIIHASSAEAMDGSISLAPEGGLAPYTYNWSNGNETSEISNLSQGEYTVTVNDATCCEETALLEIRGGCFSIKVVNKGE